MNWFCRMGFHNWKAHKNRVSKNPKFLPAWFKRCTRCSKIIALVIVLVLLCDEHWKVCPEDDYGADYQCPVSHPITPGFERR